MMNLGVNKGLLPHTIELPRSKSYANRALILAALKDGPFTIKKMPDASDVLWLISSFEQLGLKIQKEDQSVTLLGSFPKSEGHGKLLEVGEGGTTARFLAAMLLKGASPYTLKLSGRLKERPWSEFIEFVEMYGGSATLNNDELHIRGPLRLPFTVNIDCTRTTQFASGVKLAFNEETEVVPINMTSSQSYWEMTDHLIEVINTSQDFVVPIDWSSASYPLVFGAHNQEIFFPSLSPDTYQSDSKLFGLLDEFGILTPGVEGLRVLPIKKHFNVKMDVSDCLDLVPALTFFLAHIEGKHILEGTQNLLYKESNRLVELINLLKCFNREAHTERNALYIEGNRSLEGPKKLKVVNDHRIVMTAALFLRHHSGGTLDNHAAVAKSWPSFFELMK